MPNFSVYAAAITSYIVATFAIFFDAAAAHGGTVATILGFILLLARLVQEVPKAYKVIFKIKDKIND